MFSYKLSSYDGSVGTLDIFLDPTDQPINGFQLIVSLSADSPFQVLDQNQSKDQVQLDVSSRPDFTFLTNQVTKKSVSHQIALAAITSNPTSPVSISSPNLIARLHFAGQNLTSFTLTSDNQKTKIAVTDQTESLVSTDSPASLSVQQSELPQATPVPLGGQMYDVVAHQQQLEADQQPDQTNQTGMTIPSSDGVKTISAPSSNIYAYPLIIITCILLAVTVFFLIKQRRHL